MSDAIEIGKKFFKALEDGDIEAVRNIYHPDVVIWHNVDGLDRRDTGQNREESLATLEMLIKVVKDWKYDVWFREKTESGFVQHHVLRGILPNGEAFAMPVCLVCRIEDGLITRIDEHLDSAMAAQLMQGVMEAMSS